MNKVDTQMQQLKIYTFGRPRFALSSAASLKDDELSGFLTTKAEGLLVYLACTGGAHRREALAGLFWSDMAEEKAQRNLRNVLSNLRKLVGAYLSFEQHRVELVGNYWVDSVEFTQLQTANDLQAALDLYSRDFLDSFSLRNAALFDTWADGERERLHKLASNSLLKLAQQQHKALALDDCQGTLKRLLHTEPWNEAAHRLLMQVLADNGQRAAALKQYDTCRELLREELGVDPSSETVALFDLLSVEHLPVQHNLPVHSRPFIGRKKELTIIRERLNQANARLINIVGVGGIGKTSLALAAGRQTVEPLPSDLRFPDGVYYVALAEISRSVHGDNLAVAIFTAIANAIGYTFQAETKLADQLAAFFSDKQMLLILDNLEHLLDQAFLLPRLLQAAPKMQVIVTSRERLNLIEEWVLPLDGLPLPDDVSAETILASDAAALFVRHAERTVGSFTVADNAQDIADVCRAVGGLPLGIELAASWLRVVPARQIASEVQKSFDFLSSAMRNRPERHRSLRAVFDSTWQLLNEMERSVLERLSIFRGSFTRDAAATVANASLPMLIGLNDKSLVNRLDENQYTLVEYIRQYVAELRHGKAEQDRQIRGDHLAYYSRWLSGHTQRLVGQDPHISIREIEAEQENVLSAWYWAVQRKDVEAIERMFIPLTRYWRVKGTFASALSFMQTALAVVSAENRPLLHSRMLLETAFLHRGIGNTRHSIDELEKAAALLQGSDKNEVEAAIYLNLGRFQRDIGQMDAALSNLNKAHGLGEPEKMPYIYGQIVMHLGVMHRIDSVTARTVGDVAAEKRSLEEEQRLFKTALVVFRTHDHAEEEAVTLEWLGTCLNDLGQTAEAERCYRQAIGIFERIQLRYGLSSLYLNLAELALAQADAAAAIKHFGRGYHAAIESRQRLRILYVVFMASKLYEAQQNIENAIVCLAFLVNRKRWVAVMRNYCQQQLAGLNERVSAEIAAQAAQQANAATLDTTLLMIKDDFAIGSASEVAAS